MSEYAKLPNYAPPDEEVDENEPLVVNVTLPVNISVPTQGVVDEPIPQDTGTSASVWFMIFINFLSNFGFSIVLPSINQYLDSLGATSSSQLGWAIAINSLGTFLASPFVGSWSDKRPMREALAFTLIIGIIGNVMYSFSVNFWMLLAARFVVGVAAANYATVQLYMSYATTPQTRTKFMAYNSASSVLGFILGPASAAGLSFVEFKIWVIDFNENTAPGWMSALLLLLGLISLVFFKEVTRKSEAQRDFSTSSVSNYVGKQGSEYASLMAEVFDVEDDDDDGDDDDIRVRDLSSFFHTLRRRSKHIPLTAVSVCLFLNFAFTTAYTVFETIGTRYTKDDFGWGVFANGLLYGALGVECVVVLALLQFATRVGNDRVIMAICVFVMGIGYVLLINFKGKYVSLPVFVTGVALASGGYATSAALLLAIYSKILESLKQGVFMGWLSSAGSLARIIGPLFASYAWQLGGGRLLFLVTALVIFLAFAFCVVFYASLAPRQLPIGRYKEYTQGSVNN